MKINPLSIIHILCYNIYESRRVLYDKKSIIVGKKKIVFICYKASNDEWELVEIRMFLWMYNITRLHKVRNEYVKHGLE